MKDASLHNKYTYVVEDYIAKGYARRIPPDEAFPDDVVIWYLPHHPVFQPRKPDKLRIVFDCSAKVDGVSLNDALMHGPELVNNLAGVLIRFCKERIAIAANI